MGTLLEILGKVLGLGGGASALNNGVGVLGYAALIPLVKYIIDNADKPEIHITLTLGEVAIAAGVMFFVIELARRSRGNGG